MKYLFTVQRYHEQIVGGSEAATRHLAEQLASDGNEVDVVTSCSIDHRKWSNDLSSGSEYLNGVTIHRLPTLQERTAENFERLNQRMTSSIGPMLWEQSLWSRRLGPNLSGYSKWIDKHSSRYDIAISMTYMYPTTTIGLPLLARRVPSVMFPTAHDETAYRTPLFRSLARHASGLGFLTPEEQTFVTKTSRPSCPSATIGLGFESPLGVGGQALPAELQDVRYLVAVGRIDVGKGIFDLLEFFRNYKRQFPSDLKLVLVGESDFSSDDVISLGFCSEEQKNAVIAHSLALVHPSFLESFSIVLCEAWLHNRPVLVNGFCDVTKGQVLRSKGGLTFSSQAEFDCAINLFEHDDKIAGELGRRGHSYVNETYNWPRVKSLFNDLCSEAVTYFERHQKDWSIR